MTTLSDCRVIGLLNSTEVFGQERANIEVFKALRNCGADVVVGINTHHNGGQVRDYLHDLKFATFSLPFGCQWSKQFFRSRPKLLPENIAKVFRCSRILRRQIGTHNATHVHIGNQLVYSFVAPALMLNRSVQMFYRMGDAPPTDSPANMYVWRACYRRANRVVANSEFVRQSILGAADFERPIELIYNTPPTRTQNSAQAAAPADRQPNGFRALFVGQVSEHKGIRHAVAAGITLAKRHSDFRLDILGGSRYTAALEQELSREIAAAKCADRVTLRGHVSDPTSYYRQADVLIVPSLFEEPAANVVLEAKAHGVPAIVYPSGGLPELVTDGVTGWVCDQKSETELTHRLENCMAMAVCRSMADACREECEQKFGIERFHRIWSSVYADGEVPQQNDSPELQLNRAG